MKFSIISPSYNQLDYLSLAISSVRDQIQPSTSHCLPKISVEHIIQDPGTPGLVEFAKKHCAYYNKDIQIFNSRETSKSTYSLYFNRETDRGMYDAINKGLKKSTGEILAYLNCDEQYLPGTLDKVATFFKNHPCVEMVFGDALLTGSNGQAFSYRKAILPTLWHTQICHLGTLTCATFFRRSLLTRGLFFDPSWKIIGDAVWIEECLRLNVKMAIVDTPLATFSFTGANLSEAQRPGEDSELGRWGQAKGAPSWMRIPVSCVHRMRKLLAGAYQRRDVTYSIYTFDSPNQRKEFSISNIGTRWPRPATSRDAN